MIRLKRPLREGVPSLITVMVADGLCVEWLGGEVWPYAVIAAVFGAVFVFVDDDTGE